MCLYLGGDANLGPASPPRFYSVTGEKSFQISACQFAWLVIHPLGKRPLIVVEQPGRLTPQRLTTLSIKKMGITLGLLKYCLSLGHLASKGETVYFIGWAWWFPLFRAPSTSKTTLPPTSVITICARSFFPGSPASVNVNWTAASDVPLYRPVPEPM